MNSQLRLLPWRSGSCLALVTIVLGLAALILADFGTPAWWILPLWLWLVSVGLPSTVAVHLVATLWGRCEPFYGLPQFAIAATSIAICFQTVAIHLLRRSFALLP